MARAISWAVCVTFADGREASRVFERRDGRRGPILTFYTKAAAEAHAASLRLEPGDVATVIERSHGRQDVGR